MHEIGLDFYALSVDQAQEQVEVERRTSATLRAQLETVMALVKRHPIDGE